MSELGYKTWGIGAIFWICVMGTLLMGVWEWRRGYVFLLIPVLGVGLGCFRSGARLIPFLTLVVSLGGGYLCQLSHRWATGFLVKRGRALKLRLLLPAMLCVLLVVVPLKLNWEFLSVPIAPAAVASSFQKLKRMAPLDSVVWTWWDYGYFVQYWGDLGTLADGGTRRNKSSYFLGLAMASADPEFAARLMNFYSTWGYWYTFSLLRPFVGDEGGVVGLVKEMMKVGPEGAGKVSQKYGLPGDWKEFFFPGRPVHVYFSCASDMVPKGRWWYYYGTWDPQKSAGVRPTIYTTLCSSAGNGVYQCNGSILEFDPGRGMAVIEGRNVGVSEVVLVDRKGARLKRFDDRFSGLVAVLQDLNSQKWRLTVVSKDFYSSIFAKMFLVNIYYKKAFKPAVLYNPYVQIWKVKNPDQT